MLPGIEWTTPARLKALIGASWVLVIALGAAVASNAAAHRRSVQVIAVDAAPSVVAALRIKLEIESLDAALINEMLVPPGEAKAWSDDFGAHRVKIGRDLLAATRSAFGDAEMAPLDRIQEALGRYLIATQEAREAHRRGESGPALAAYLASFQILDRELVPAASELDRINNTELDAVYEEQLGGSRRARILVGAIGVALIGFLALVQRYVARRFRRRISPALAIATLLAIGLGGCAIRAFGANADALKGVKQDSYDSVANLLATRAHAYEANSAESRWLLDRAGSDEHERRFHEYVRKLAALPPGGSFEQVAETARRRNAILAARLRAGDDPVTAGAHARTELPLTGHAGTLVVALDNITFPDPAPEKDEPTQSAETARAFAVYHAADARIRELELGGRHAEAVAFCLSMKPGDSNWAFFQFDEALSRWIAINEGWLRRSRGAARTRGECARARAGPVRAARAAIEHRRAGAADRDRGPVRRVQGRRPEGAPGARVLDLRRREPARPTLERRRADRRARRR